MLKDKVSSEAGACPGDEGACARHSALDEASSLVVDVGDEAFDFLRKIDRTAEVTLVIVASVER